MNAKPSTLPSLSDRDGAGDHDPRVILIAFLCVGIWISYAPGLFSAIVGLGIALLTVMLPGPGRDRWARVASTFRWSFLFAIIVFVLYVLLSSPVEPAWWQFGPVALSKSGCLTGARLSLTFIAFVALARSLLLYATPSGLAAALTWMLRPLRFLGLKPEILYGFVFVTLRLIPGMVAESRTIRFAQRSRGWRARGSWWSRIRGTKAIIIPVFAAAMRRADTRSIELASRGIDLSSTPEAVRTLRLRPIDYVVLALAIVLATIGLYMRLN